MLCLIITRRNCLGMVSSKIEVTVSKTNLLNYHDYFLIVQKFCSHTHSFLKKLLLDSGVLETCICSENLNSNFWANYTSSSLTSECSYNELLFHYKFCLQSLRCKMSDSVFNAVASSAHFYLFV